MRLRAPIGRADHVQATLYYQSIPPSYLQERFADASQVAGIHERGVALTIDAAAARRLPEPSSGQLRRAPGLG